MYPAGLLSVGTVLMSFRACSREVYDNLSIFLEAVSPMRRHTFRVGNDTRIPLLPYVWQATRPHNSLKAFIDMLILERTAMLARYLMWIGDMARK